jgi:hypothetical protein
VGKREGKRFLERPTVRRDREILLKRNLKKLRCEGDGLDKSDSDSYTSLSHKYAKIKSV